MEFEELGIREECGVFGCIASGLWPTELDVPHVITLGLVGLQHSCRRPSVPRSAASSHPGKGKGKNFHFCASLPA
uniref:Glutamine amidotransferase type-2 domain-containing protein n=1 Tax=Podarcis muralis TaxID=64176 RepID=A0A670KLX4_PODMU